ncbi:MAG: hypothetical protein Q9172_007091 [Xanthocarpia lactea]
MPVFLGTGTPQPPTSVPIILQVGEQRFHVNQDTLSGSEMLAAKVSRRWDSDKQADGSYFVDGDPEVFTHILRFLRLGVYPLCYDNLKGHDYGLYTAIQKQADYLGVEHLVAWLAKKRYLQAIVTETKARLMEDEDEIAGTYSSDVLMEYFPTWRTVKKYVCPRGIGKHYGNPGGCGRACRSAQGDAEEEYEDCQVVTTLALEKTTVFNQTVCMEE